MWSWWIGKDWGRQFRSATPEGATTRLMRRETIAESPHFFAHREASCARPRLEGVTPLRLAVMFCLRFQAWTDPGPGARPRLYGTAHSRGRGNDPGQGCGVNRRSGLEARFCECYAVVKKSGLTCCFPISRVESIGRWRSPGLRWFRSLLLGRRTSYATAQTTSGFAFSLRKNHPR